MRAWYLDERTAVSCDFSYAIFRIWIVLLTNRASLWFCLSIAVSVRVSWLLELLCERNG
jgi:hypothetical protein